jgi:DNA helicase TIP49 (TBP-interacting protein)
MKSIFSKAVVTAVIASIFALNVQAGTVHVMAADTGKMDKMGKMDHKMDKKMKKMKKKDKMMKDTTGKM